MASDLAHSSGSTSSCCDIQGLNVLYNDLVTALSATFDPGANKDTAESAKSLGAVREQFFNECNDVIQGLVVLQQQLSLGQATAVQQQQRQQEHHFAGHAAGVAPPDNVEVDGQQLELQPEQEHLLAVQQQSAHAVTALVQQHDSFVQQLQNTVSSAGNGTAG